MADTKIKAKNMMYVQDLEHLPFETIDELEDCIIHSVKPKKYALILHDKDVKKDGQKKRDHIHVMLEFENPRYLTAIAKKLKDKPQNIESYNNGKEDRNNGFSYLVHRTKKSRSDYQYDPNEVRANFDYPALLEEIETGITASSMSIKDKLDLLYLGHITREEIENTITGSQYAKYKRQIENVHSKMLIRKAEEWRKVAIAENLQLTVIWIYGLTATGKTTLAKSIVKNKAGDIYISGSSRDLFQQYNGERKIILDELRPGIIEYQDFLRILDPYGITSSIVMAPSRYQDKALSCDTIIITSPYDPYSYYQELIKRNRINDDIDKFNQLLRRITLTIHTTPCYIFESEFNERDVKYQNIISTKRDNPFSEIKRGSEDHIVSSDLYKSIVSEL